MISRWKKKIMQRWTGVKEALKIVAASAMLLAVFLTSVAVSKPVPVKPKSVIDDETVYAVMDAHGKPNKTIVVDWLRIEGDGLVEVADRGDASRIKALKDDVDPMIRDENIIWQLDVDGMKDFYYRAETKKELPVAVDVMYYLDGVEISPEELAGKDGRLKITINVENRLKKKVKYSYTGADDVTVKEKEEEIYIPLITVASLSFKASKFSNIDAGEGMLSVTGEQMSCTISLFPQGEDEAVIEMDGKDIELDPIIISVMPKMPQLPEMEIEDQLQDMKESFDPSEFEQLSEAMSGFSLLGDAINETRKGTDGMALLVGGQIQMLNRIIDGIDTSQFENTSELVTALEDLSAGLESTKSGLDEIILLLDDQIGVLQGIQASNNGLIQLAQDRQGAYPGDTIIAALANGLVQQGKMITAVTDGGDVGFDYMPGLNEAKSDLEAISTGLASSISGLKAISAEAKLLNEIPAAFSAIKQSLIVLREGGTIKGITMPGLTATLDGLRGLSSGLSSMESGFSSMGGELGGLESLTGSLSGFEDTIEEIRAREALADKMREEADAYDSFLGKPDGADGRVRFLLRLDAIKK